MTSHKLWHACCYLKICDPSDPICASFAPSSPPIFVPKQRDQCINCQSQLNSCIWHCIRCVGQGFCYFCCCLQCDLSQFIYHLDILQKIQCVHYVRKIITFQPQPCVSFLLYTCCMVYLTTMFHYSKKSAGLVFCSHAFRPTKTWGQELRCQDVRLLPNAWHSAPRTRAVGRKLPPLGPCRFRELIYYEWLTDDIVMMYWWLNMMYIIWIILGIFFLIYIYIIYW